MLLAEVLPDIDLAAVAAEKLYGFMLRLFRLADAFEAFFGFFTGHSAVGVGYDGSNSLYGVFVGRGMSGRLIGLIAVLLLAYFAVSSLMSAAASGYRKRKLIRVSLKKMFVFIITVAAVLVPANLAAMVLSKTREIFFMPPYPSVGAGFYAALFTRQADLDAQAVPYWFQPYDDMASDPGRVMIYAGVALGLFVAVTAIISSLLFIKRMAGAVICLVSSPPVMRDGSEEGAYVFARWRDRFVSTAWSGLSCAYVLKALFLFASFLLSGNQLFSGQEDSNALAAVLIIGAACLVALSLIFLSDAALVRRGAVRVFFVWKARRRLSTAAEYRIPLWNGVLASGEDFIYRHIKTSGVLIGLSGFACATLAYMTNGPVKYYLVPAAVLLSATALTPMNQDGDRIYALVPRLIRHLAYKKSFAVPCGGLEQTVREESARVTLDYDIPVTASETAGKLVKVWKKNVRGASASQYDIRDMIPYTDIETDCVVYGQDTLACVLELDAGRADEKHTLALEAVKSVLADGAPGNVLSLVFFGAARAGEESAPSLYLVLYGADKKALRARAGEAQTLLRNGGFGCAILKDRDLARFMRRNYSHPFDKTLNAVPERDLYAWSLPWSMRIFRNRLKIEDTAVSCYRVARYPAAAWDEALFSLPGVKVVMQIHAVAETASRRRARREMDGGFIEKTGQAPPLLTDIADGVEKVADVNTYVSAYYPAFPDKKRGIQSAVPQLDRLRAEGFELDPLYLQQFDAYVGAGITKGDPLRHKAMGVPLGTIADMITLACAARRRAENGSAELTHR